GLDMGSQLIAGGVNGVVNATKQAASKNIKKVKVTIKTNYAVFLMEKKETGES
ncbi:conjugative transposon protein TraM, partial [Phocaeicola vulgatus]